MARKQIHPKLYSHIKENYNTHCRYCGNDKAEWYEIDHIHPVSKNGSNDASNLTVACNVCNSSKGCKMLDEWLYHKEKKAQECYNQCVRYIDRLRTAKHRGTINKDPYFKPWITDKINQLFNEFRKHNRIVWNIKKGRHTL
jgi:hypothetical protein